MSRDKVHVTMVASLVDAAEAAQDLADAKLEARFILLLQEFLMAWYRELSTTMECRPGLRSYRVEA